MAAIATLRSGETVRLAITSSEVEDEINRATDNGLVGAGAIDIRLPTADGREIVYADVNTLADEADMEAL